MKKEDERRLGRVLRIIATTLMALLATMYALDAIKQHGEPLSVTVAASVAFAAGVQCTIAVLHKRLCAGKIETQRDPSFPTNDS